MRAVTLVSLLIALGACADEGPPAATAEEAEQLNEADAMLNAEAERERP